jgi:hypothetical protein
MTIFRHCLVYLGVAEELLPPKSLILGIKKVWTIVLSSKIKKTHLGQKNVV